jgi:hypothetical protein
MKFSNLFVSALTGCLLVGASGAAIAENTCESGFITGVVEEDIVISGGPLAGCDINGATVRGNIIATGADVNIQFTDVSGVIRLVDGDTAVISGSTATRIRVARNKAAFLLGNVVNERIVVNRNQIARVKKNLAVDLIRCRFNEDLRASYNTVGPAGTEECGAF